MRSIPSDFRRALRGSGLEEYFQESAYVPRADYLSWIAAAKLPETRRQRIRKAVVRLFEQWREEMLAVRAELDAPNCLTTMMDGAASAISTARRSA